MFDRDLSNVCPELSNDGPRRRRRVGTALPNCEAALFADARQTVTSWGHTDSSHGTALEGHAEPLD